MGTKKIVGDLKVTGDLYVTNNISVNRISLLEIPDSENSAARIADTTRTIDVTDKTQVPEKYRDKLSVQPWKFYIFDNYIIYRYLKTDDNNKAIYQAWINTEADCVIINYKELSIDLESFTIGKATANFNIPLLTDSNDFAGTQTFEKAVVTNAPINATDVIRKEDSDNQFNIIMSYVDEKVDKIINTDGTYVYGTEEGGDTAFPLNSDAAADVVVRRTGTQINLPNQIQDAPTADQAISSRFADNKYLAKAGGTISGNLAITGDLTVSGTTTAETQEQLLVKANVIATNADKVDLKTLLSGLAINKNPTATYGIMYDPADDTVKFGEGTLSADNKFVFKEGEGHPLAIRADSNTFADAHLIKWDAATNSFVDAGITLADMSSATNIENGSGVNSLKQKPDGETFSGLKDGLGADSDLTKNDSSIIAEFNTDAAGQNSTILGGKNRAIAKRSTTIGGYNIANGASSLATGEQTRTDGRGAFTAGQRTFAKGGSSVATGGYSKAIGDFSFTQGYATTAEGRSAMSVGAGTKAKGDASFASGSGSQANGAASFATGDSTTAQGVNAFASGVNTHANGTNSAVFGDSSVAGAPSALVAGRHNISNNTKYVAPTPGGGGGTVEPQPPSDFNVEEHYGEGASITGAYNSAYGFAASATGLKTSARGHYSRAEGVSTIASGEGSHAQGGNTEASGNYATAEGTGTKAQGVNSHTEGESTIASGTNSHAAGHATLASGINSFASGDASKATGSASFTTGTNTTAKGDNAFAGGTGTQASNTNTVALGSGTVASGINATALGVNTKAEGPNSFANGNGSQAKGINAFANGSNTIARKDHQAALGLYIDSGINSVGGGLFVGHNNDPKENALFQIGNGGASGRSNALTIFDDGTSEFENTISIKQGIDKLNAAGVKEGAVPIRYIVSGAASSGAMETEHEYFIGSAATIDWSFPQTGIAAGFYSVLHFASGSEATVFQIDTDSIQTGDDCKDGVFTPKSNMSYTIICWYDGTKKRCAVSGVPTDGQWEEEKSNVAIGSATTFTDLKKIVYTLDADIPTTPESGVEYADTDFIGYNDLDSNLQSKIDDAITMDSLKAGDGIAIEANTSGGVEVKVDPAKNYLTNTTISSGLMPVATKEGWSGISYNNTNIPNALVRRNSNGDFAASHVVLNTPAALDQAARIYEVGEIVSINAPADVTTGTLPTDQLQSINRVICSLNGGVNNNAWILFGNKRFYPMSGHQKDYRTYTNVDSENNNFIIKAITVTFATGEWVLNTLIASPKLYKHVVTPTGVGFSLIDYSTISTPYTPEQMSKTYHLICGYYAGGSGGPIVGPVAVSLDSASGMVGFNLKYLANSGTGYTETAGSELMAVDSWTDTVTPL